MSEYPIPEDLTTTQKLRGRAVTHEEGAASIQRLINSRFKNDNGARCSIPARADDDDIVASDYAKECRERIAKQDAQIKRLWGALDDLLVRHCDGSEEAHWAEWDAANAALKETEEQG